MEDKVLKPDNPALKNGKEKDRVEIESDFFNRYRSQKCISFDYGLSHEFSPEDVEDLLHLVSTHGGNCPFNVFYLGAYTPAIKDFLETCAPSLTELHLAHWSYRDFKFFTEDVPRNLNLSGLKKLHIKLIVDDGEVYNVKKFFAFIAEIFRGAQSLQELSCNFPGDWDGEAMEELLRSLVAGEDNGLLRSLKRLKLLGRFLPTHFLILSALDNLRLKRLSLKFCGVLGNLSPVFIKRFLQSQSSSLETLHIEDVNSTTKCSITFPRMEKLKALKISGSCFGETGITFGKLAYSKQLPNVASLDLVRVGQSEWDTFVNEQTLPCFTLRKLTVKDSEVKNFQVTNAPGAIKTKLIFPNLDEFLHD